MFLHLTHTKFEVFQLSGEIVVECYRLMALLPATEKFSLISQIKRAALSVKLNIAEGASRKSISERKRFYEIARSSLVELDAGFDICLDLSFLTEENVKRLSEMVNSCYAMLSKLIAL